MATKRTLRKRRRNTSTWIIGGIVVVALVAVIVIAMSGSSSTSASVVASPPPPAALDKCGSATCGNANAPVTIDVYADFQCPYCAQFDPVLQRLAPDYIDTGKVKLVYHHFTVIGPESVTAAQAASCAGDQNRFWMFANDLFAYQGAENSGVFSAANLKKMAAAAGLDATAFNTCLDSGKYASQVTQQKAEGVQRGIQATPTFFVNGKVHEGSATYDQLVSLINAAQPQ